MNIFNRSVLSREKQGGGGGSAGNGRMLNSMEERCYPRASSPLRDLDYMPDGWRGAVTQISHTPNPPYSMPNDMIKHRERERMSGYHSSPHYSTSPSVGGGDRDDNMIKYLERERTLMGGGGSGSGDGGIGYPHHSSASRYQQELPYGSSWDDVPVQDLHDNGEGGRYNDPYGDTRRYHTHNHHHHHQNYHQNRYDDREDAIRKKEAALAGTATHEKMIEVVPGFQMRLRGAEETWAAVERDFFGPATCFSCEMTVFCILDAEYILCPTCKVVFPFEQDGGCDEKSKKGAGGGVGLGFSMEDLARFQSDIVSRYS